MVDDAIKKVGTDHAFKREIYWSLVIFYGTLHLLGCYGLYRACFHCHPLTLVYTIIVGNASQVGVTMGAHRLYAHKAFKAKLPLRITLILLNTVAGMVIDHYNIDVFHKVRVNVNHFKIYTGCAKNSVKRRSEDTDANLCSNRVNNFFPIFFSILDLQEIMSHRARNY
nr:unnamed protein product [Callosobruchus analis]